MSETALVIIDLQKAILRGPEANPARRQAILDALDQTAARIAGLLARARAAQAPVFLVQHDGPAGHRLEVGSAGWQLREEITPLPGEPIIHKTACDAFFATTLDAQLRVRGIRRLAVAGCMTQFCIDTSVRRAVSLGYDVLLAADGHMTEDFGGLGFEQIIAHHNQLLDGFDAGANQVRVLTAAEIAW